MMSNGENSEGLKLTIAQPNDREYYLVYELVFKDERNRLTS